MTSCTERRTTKRVYTEYQLTSDTTSLYNTANSDEKFRAEVEDRLTSEYHNTSHTPVPSIDVSSLLVHIAKLKKGKAAGLDGIVNEHILYGDDCLNGGGRSAPI